MEDQKSGNNYFDQAAASWEDSPMRIELTRAIADAIIRQIPLSQTMNAMEFGCGTGLVAMRIATHVRRLVAVDTSAKMLEVLERKIRQNHIDNIQPLRMDLTADTFPDERFDLVFTSMAMHHIKDIPHLLGILNRLLNPGGYLAIADLDTEDGGFHGDIPDVFHHGFARPAFAGLMETAGFSGINIVTAHILKKESAKTGLPADFPVFLAVGNKQASALPAA